MSIVKVFYDLETTGVNVKRNGIHQIAGIVEIDGNVVETFDIKVAPHPKCEIEDRAMEVCGKTEDEVRSYQAMKKGFRKFKSIVKKYIDPYNKKDKAFLVGFNNRYFDDNFLRAWFEHNGDQYFGSLFWVNSLDVFVLASEYLLERRADMPSFKLKRVAKELGIFVDEERLHDALYDAELTREIYRICTRLEIEL